MATTPPTAARRAHIKILHILGIVGVVEPITAEAMQAYEGLSAVPISRNILRAIAKHVDRELPDDPKTAPITTVITSSPIEAYPRLHPMRQSLSLWITASR